LKSIILAALVIPSLAVATPIMLECAVTYPVAERTYQITFDAAAHTVAVDDEKPVKANITETLITWTERGAELGARWTTAWTINRLTGAWRMVTAGSAAYGGQCTAPPPRKF
jgi:hypothetical protein